MASEVTIVNRAATLLADSRKITAFSDDSPLARLATRDYADFRDKLLRTHPWNFAMRQWSLPASATAPTHTYARAFPLPADVLSVRTVVDTAKRDWKVFGRSIYTDIEAPLAITGTAQITDVSQMDPSFREALAAGLAWGWAPELAGSESVHEARGRYFAVAFQEAKTDDGQEGELDSIDTSTWIDARF